MGPEKPVGSMPTWRRRYLTLSMTTFLVNGPGIEVELAGYIVKSCGRTGQTMDSGIVVREIGIPRRKGALFELVKANECY
jgi:hypothetical protein